MKNRCIKNILALLCFLGATSTSIHALDFKIQVLDPKKNEGLADVQVIILETQTKFSTDEKGFVNATVPKAGFYTIRAILPTGKLVQPRFEIQSPNQLITILTEEAPQKETKQQVVGEDGINVTGRRGKSKLSRYQQRIDEIKRIPGQFGEALKGIETLPGVNAPPFGQGQIIIRGANENANTYLLDDLPIGYVYHFAGFNSVVHNDFIKTIDTYTGAYPAEFGDATGGVIAIESIDDVPKFGGHATVSFWSANALFKGPLGDENNGYWIGAARGSYLDKTLKPYIPSGTELIPKYGDGQFKLKYTFTPNHIIYAYALTAKDTFIAKIDDQPSWDPTAEFSPRLIGASIAFDRAFDTEAVRYVWQPGSRFSNQLTVLHHDNIFYIDGSIGEIDARQKQSDGYYAVRDDLTWEMMKDHIFFDAGVEYRSFIYKLAGVDIQQTDPTNRTPDPYNPNDFTTIPVSEDVRTNWTSGYAVLTFRGLGFEFKPSARVDYFGLTGERVIDPRATASYTFKTKTTLVVGAGVYHKLPEPYQYSPDSANPFLKMERADHYGGGVEQIYGDWTFKAEVFRHYFTEMIVQDAYVTRPYKINEDNSLQNRIRDPILYNERMFYSNDGTGFSEGYELYFKKTKAENKNGWYGWISYTWSRTIRNDHQHIVTDEEKKTLYSADERRVVNQYDNTKDYYASFDRTHIINIIFGYKISPEWQVGAKWRYMTSELFTPVTDDNGGRTISNGRVVFDPVYDETRKNTQRLKPWHRLDIRVDRFFNYSWGFGNYFFEVLNAYVRDNPTTIGWDDARPISLTNPYVVNDFGTLEAPGPNGKKVKSPLINFGIEVQF